MLQRHEKRNISVLIAEDDPTMRHLMATLLSRRGISCTLVENGRSALDAWEEDQFDLILMDVQMPILDGLKATRMIRERESVRGGHTVIIAMTAHAMATDREKCLEAGMDAYVSKPIKFDDLLSLITNYSISTSKKNAE
jgi:CheY-like chemotaxis protein